MSGGEPGPGFEAPSAPETVSDDSEAKVEQGRPAYQESSATKAPAQALPSLQFSTNAPTAQPPDDKTQADDDRPQPPPPTAHLPAANSNLIEKEWVDKAKEVVAKTKNDPYSQKKAVSDIKADYIQKRFNKSIKTDDAVAA